MGMAVRPKGAYTSCHNFMPSPWYSQAIWPIKLIPKGTVVKYWAANVVPDQKFGYYDDDEDEDECIVYHGEPLMGPCQVFPRSELRKPPFNGKLVAM